MKYTYAQLISDIIDYCEGEMTTIDRTFEYDSVDALVSGIVSQDFDYTPPTPDGLNPPWYDLDSRCATIDSVVVYYYSDGELSKTVEFNNEQLYQLEKDIEL